MFSGLLFRVRVMFFGLTFEGYPSIFQSRVSGFLENFLGYGVGRKGVFLKIARILSQKISFLHP